MRWKELDNRSALHATSPHKTYHNFNSDKTKNDNERFIDIRNDKGLGNCLLAAPGLHNYNDLRNNIGSKNVLHSFEAQLGLKWNNFFFL